MRIGVLIPAAGTGSRFGGNKLLARLMDRPVIAHTLEAFAGRPDVARLIVATRDTGVIDICAEYDVCRCVGGGPTRAASVQAALAALPRDIDVVCVHDAARPLVSRGLIDRCFAAVEASDAVAAAVAITSTVKRAAPPLPAKVLQTLDRRELFALQTPQVMKRRLLEDAYRQTPLNLAEVTDDLQLLESVGVQTHLVMGEARNLKITHAEDLIIAEAMLRAGHLR